MCNKLVLSLYSLLKRFMNKNMHTTYEIIIHSYVSLEYDFIIVLLHPTT